MKNVNIISAKQFTTETIAKHDKHEHVSMIKKFIDMMKDEKEFIVNRKDVHMLNVSDGNSKLHTEKYIIGTVGIDDIKTGNHWHYIPEREQRLKGKVTVSKGKYYFTPDDAIRFIIWNIPAVFTCPGATNNCIEACYAVDSELNYPGTVQSRIRNYFESLNSMFVENMLYTIRTIMSKPSYKRARKVIFRIHESGDFYSMKYANDWKYIIAMCEPYVSLQFMSYTKSFWYFDGYMVPKNYGFLASVWSDTEQDAKDIINRNNFRVYTAVNASVYEQLPEDNKCHCKDCAQCVKCPLKDGIKELYVVIHGESELAKQAKIS